MLGCAASVCHAPRWERPSGNDAQSFPKRRLGYCFSAATHAAGGGRYSVYRRTQWVFLPSGNVRLQQAGRCTRPGLSVRVVAPGLLACNIAFVCSMRGDLRSAVAVEVCQVVTAYGVCRGRRAGGISDTHALVVTAAGASLGKSRTDSQPRRLASRSIRCNATVQTRATRRCSHTRRQRPFRHPRRR